MDERSGRELILHVGHHKTATSFLQKQVFPNARKLVYFYKKEHPFSAQVIDCFDLSPGVWRERGEALFSQLERALSAAGEQGKNGALISAEAMSAHRLFADPSLGLPRRDPYLLAAHLQACSQLASQHGFRLKVFLSFRRQDQYFASRFASVGRRAGEVSQACFETRCEQMLDPDQRYYLDGIWLDYHLCLQLIGQAIGTQALLMLPQEHLAEHSDAFLRRLGDFLREPELSAARQQLTWENQRRQSEDRWRVQRQGASRIAERVLAGIGVAPDRVLGTKTIQLPENLKRRILSRYRDSNQALASALNLDLQKYGYW